VTNAHATMILLTIRTKVEKKNIKTTHTTHLPTPEGWMAELAMLADR